MRHIAYLLLVGNILYLGWNLFQDQSAVDTVAGLPPLPDGVHRLVTLQEHVHNTSNTDANMIEALTQAEPPSALGVAGCKAFGPFAAKADVEPVAARLADMGLDPVLHAVDSQVDNGYWIYLPGESRDGARDIVSQLQSKGDKEYFVGKDHVVSLGTFDGIERSQVRIDELRKMGFDPVLEQRFKTRQAFWLEMPASQVSSEVLNMLAAEYPGLEAHALSCR
jgi:hypothetical protein